MFQKSLPSILIARLMMRIQACLSKMLMKDGELSAGAVEVDEQWWNARLDSRDSAEERCCPWTENKAAAPQPSCHMTEAHGR